MSFWRIVIKSLRQHWLSTALAVVSIALGVALLVAVVSLREQAHRNFTQEGLGVDAVLGPKGSPLQIVLNALYHLEEMPGKIRWTYYEKVLADPVVESGIPFITGHSYAGFRVNAIDDQFFTEFEYLPGKHFSMRSEDGGQGRVFQNSDEAVAGYEVARALHLSLGQVFNPTCGVNAGDPVHVNDFIKFVGIMAPTGREPHIARKMPGVLPGTHATFRGASCRPVFGGSAAAAGGGESARFNISTFGTEPEPI